MHCVAHNGDRVASGGHNGVVIVHDVRTGEQLLTIEGTARSIVTGMKAQGGRLAVSGYDKSARCAEFAQQSASEVQGSSGRYKRCYNHV